MSSRAKSGAHSEPQSAPHFERANPGRSRHDEGGLVDFGTAAATLQRFGYNIASLGSAPETAGPRGPLPWVRPIPLPFLWVHGRRDATISVMGANIYPEDIETIVYRDPDLVPRLHSFLLSVG